MLSARLKTTNGEPPAKKLRISEQRSGAIRQLPSPDASLGSSSENTGLASSISPKRKLSQSFRDRILTRNDERSGTVPDVLPSQSKLRTKTSIAPIFKHNIAATWEAGTESGSNIPKPLKQSVREPSPEPDPEDLIKKLKRLYRNSAETIYERSMIQLQQAHSDVTRKLRESMKGEETFLTKMDKQNKTLCAPLDKFLIRSQQHDPVDGSVSVETDTVGELVANVETQVAEFEADLAKLWGELEVADAEVARAYRENLTDRRASHDGEAAQISDTLTQLWVEIKKQIQGAEQEIAELSDAAVAAMKVVEKEYRKATLPDLHVFFQSIDEP